MEDFVSIARIVKKHGIRGEVAAELLTAFPARFSSLQRVRIEGPAGTSWQEIEQYRFHQGRVLLKFRGLASAEEVEKLIGSWVQVPAGERFPAPRGSYYHSDLIGCEVVEADKMLGRVSGIFETGGEGVNLVIRTPEDEEFMVPLVRALIPSIDLEARRIEVELPGGLVPGSEQ